MVKENLKKKKKKRIGKIEKNGGNARNNKPISSYKLSKDGSSYSVRGLWMVGFVDSLQTAWYYSWVKELSDPNNLVNIEWMELCM